VEKNLVSLVWFISLCSALVYSACSSQGSTANQEKSVEGTVYVTGNEPFTRLALVAEDGTRYLLSCTKELEELLNRSQGRKVRIRYSREEQGPDGRVLSVIGVVPVGG
jgi:hypothetical protein